MATRLDNLSSLLGISQAVRGRSETQTQKTSGSTSTQANISEAGMQRVIDQILAGQGGIKDISGAARGAGLFNASTEAQLTNDLVARTAGELAARQEGSTTTTDQTVTTQIQQPGTGLGGLLGPMAAMSVAKPLLEGALGLGGSTAANAGNAITSIFQAPVASGGSSFLSGGAGDLLGRSLGDVSIGSGVGASLGSGFGSAISDAGAGVAQGGVGAIFNSIPGVGNFLGGLFGGGDPSDMTGLGIGTAALQGLATMGPVGLLAAPAMALLGSSLGNISVICTALKERGLLNRRQYEEGRVYLNNMSAYTRYGYLDMFVGIAGKIEKGSKFWTNVCLPFARGRTNLLASKSKWKYLKHPIGSITKFIGEPICYIRGYYLTRKFRSITTKG